MQTTPSPQRLNFGPLTQAAVIALLTVAVCSASYWASVRLGTWTDLWLSMSLLFGLLAAFGVFYQPRWDDTIVDFAQVALKSFGVSFTGALAISLFLWLNQQMPAVDIAWFGIVFGIAVMMLISHTQHARWPDWNLRWGIALWCGIIAMPTALAVLYGLGVFFATIAATPI